MGSMAPPPGVIKTEVSQAAKNWSKGLAYKNFKRMQRSAQEKQAKLDQKFLLKQSQKKQKHRGH